MGGLQNKPKTGNWQQQKTRCRGVTPKFGRAKGQIFRINSLIWEECELTGFSADHPPETASSGSLCMSDTKVGSFELVEDAAALEKVMQHLKG
ncbi:MAG TPA: hypothetical protein VHS96_07940, partial [Bacteroidia bacterium]|nr:hypothetical protein [Bacteroidia bacterium]